MRKTLKITGICLVLLAHLMTLSPSAADQMGGVEGGGAAEPGGHIEEMYEPEGGESESAEGHEDPEGGEPDNLGNGNDDDKDAIGEGKEAGGEVFEDGDGSGQDDIEGGPGILEQTDPGWLPQQSFSMSSAAIEVTVTNIAGLRAAVADAPTDGTPVVITLDTTAAISVGADPVEILEGQDITITREGVVRNINSSADTSNVFIVMEGGKLVYEGSAGTGTGIILVDGGEFETHGSNIRRLAVMNGGTAVTDGNISSNITVDGGNSSLTIIGGTVSGSAAVSSGGTVTLTGGTVSSSPTVSGSGSLYAVMGGSILSTITVSAEGSVEIADGAAGNITVNAGGHAEVSGGNANNITVNSNGSAALSGGTLSGNVTVSAAGAAFAMSGGTVEGVITLNNAAASLLISNGRAERVEARNGSMTMTGGSIGWLSWWGAPPDITGGTVEMSIQSPVLTIAELRAAVNAAPADGTETVIWLCNPSAISAANTPIEIAAGKNIALKGVGITRLLNSANMTANVFTVRPGGKLEYGLNISTATGLISVPGGEFLLPGGSIQSVNITDGGSIEINGGTVVNIAHVADSSFSMQSGTAGVVEFRGGSFTMSGGHIAILDIDDDYDLDITGGTIGEMRQLQTAIIVTNTVELRAAVENAPDDGSETVIWYRGTSNTEMGNDPIIIADGKNILLRKESGAPWVIYNANIMNSDVFVVLEGGRLVFDRNISADRYAVLVTGGLFELKSGLAGSIMVSDGGEVIISDGGRITSSSSYVNTGGTLTVLAGGVVEQSATVNGGNLAVNGGVVAGVSLSGSGSGFAITDGAAGAVTTPNGSSGQAILVSGGTLASISTAGSSDAAVNMTGGSVTGAAAVTGTRSALIVDGGEMHGTVSLGSTASITVNGGNIGTITSSSGSLMIHSGTISQISMSLGRIEMTGGHIDILNILSVSNANNYIFAGGTIGEIRLPPVTSTEILRLAILISPTDGTEAIIKFQGNVVIGSTVIIDGGRNITLSSEEGGMMSGANNTFQVMHGSRLAFDAPTNPNQGIPARIIADGGTAIARNGVFYDLIAQNGGKLELRGADTTNMTIHGIDSLGTVHEGTARSINAYNDCVLRIHGGTVSSIWAYNDAEIIMLNGLIDGQWNSPVTVQAGASFTMYDGIIQCDRISSSGGIELHGVNVWRGGSFEMHGGIIEGVGMGGNAGVLLAPLNNSIGGTGYRDSPVEGFFTMHGGKINGHRIGVAIMRRGNTNFIMNDGIISDNENGIYIDPSATSNSISLTVLINGGIIENNKSETWWGSAIHVFRDGPDYNIIVNGGSIINNESAFGSAVQVWDYGALAIDPAVNFSGNVNESLLSLSPPLNRPDFGIANLGMSVELPIVSRGDYSERGNPQNILGTQTSIPGTHLLNDVDVNYGRPPGIMYHRNLEWLETEHGAPPSWFSYSSAHNMQPPPAAGNATVSAVLPSYTGPDPGFTFAGWGTSEDALATGGDIYAPGEHLGWLNGILVLYAQWAPKPMKFEVIWHPGEHGGFDPQEHFVVSGEPTPPFAGEPWTDAYGWEFDRWDEEPHGTVLQDITYTALWRRIEAEVTVTFNPNHGNEGSFEITLEGYLSEMPFMLGGDMPPRPERAGYIFRGWNTEPGGTGTELTAGTEIWENMDVYAQWGREEMLPETGGAGRTVMYAAGFGLLAGLAGVFAVRGVRRRCYEQAD